MKKLLAAALLAALSFPALAQWPGYTSRAAGGGGSGTVNSGTTGQFAYYAEDGTALSGITVPSLTGTPAAGDLSYWTGASAQALLTPGSAGAYLRSAGTGAAPIWSTLILPNAMTSGGVLYGSAANQVATSGALTANAFITGGGAGAAPNSVALTGIVQGNGASAPTAITPGTGVATALAQNVTGSGGIVLATSPTLTTPNIGAATGTSVALTATVTSGAEDTVTAAGSSQGTATALSATVNYHRISSATTNQGVILPTAVVGQQHWVFNSTNAPVFVYPASGETIANLATDAGSLSSAGSSKGFLATATGTWRILASSSLSSSDLNVPLSFTQSGQASATLAGLSRRVFSSTAPSSPVACTSPSVVTSNGTAGFQVNVGTSCTGVSTIGLTMPAATTGWSCQARNVSNGASSAPAQTGAVSTTAITITNFARTTGLAADWTDSDVVEISCQGY